MKVLIVYRDFLLDGGLPKDARSFVSEFPEEVDITVICKKKESNKISFNGNIFTVDSIKDIMLKTFAQNYDYVIYIGFSSLYNVFLAKKINVPYVILPFSQINRFLDYDNPFFEHILPDVKNLENSEFRYPEYSRVKNGNRDVFSYLRRYKRGLYRKTLGYSFLKKAEAIGVFSKFEKLQIEDIYRGNNFAYFYYRFGLYHEDLTVGSDKFDSNDKLKLVFWSRADFYYKGIDRILRAIKCLIEEGSDIAFKLYIVGPDYNMGYKKTHNYLEEYSLGAHVELVKTGGYTPGTLGLLASADLSVCLSRWDGPPRVIRESLTLGVPVLASKEANFDLYLEKLNCGYLSASQEELVDILRSLNLNDIRVKKSNAQKFGGYFEWKKTSEDFISQLKKLNQNSF